MWAKGCYFPIQFYVVLRGLKGSLLRGTTLLEIVRREIDLSTV